MRRHRDEDDYGYYFPREKTRAVNGGIKAESRRGGFAKNWWAKRWLAVLESFNIGARLGRGKRYARTGQVVSIEVDRELVTALVQGSRPKPYSVVIRVKPLSHEQWDQVARHLVTQAIFAAKLLTGEMPTEIEEAFTELGLSLFPERSADLETHCSCPDWSNPCKHIAAVYYLLGEEFDRDPFLLFKLRGMEREKLLEMLAGAGQPVAQAGALAIPVAEEKAVAEPLPVDPADFWHGLPLPEDPFGEVVAPGVPAALAKRLGKFPFWRGEQPLLEALEPAYRKASAAGLSLFLANSEE